MPQYTQRNRKIQLITPLGEDALLLQGFRGREAVSELFRFDLHILSTNRSVSFKDVVGKSATIKILCGSGRERFINGVVSSFTQGGMTANSQLASYTATLVPWTWLLTRTSDCRIFQPPHTPAKVPDIIEEVFKKAGPAAKFDNRLRGTYPEREYCVQYRETDFNFVSRLMEEEGIFYFFEHERGKHTLVLADSPAEFKPSPHQQAISYVSQIGEAAGRESVTSWSATQEVRPGKYTADDYNFEKPNLDLTASAEGQDERKYELYDYPGGFMSRDEGDRVAAVRAQEQDSPLVVISGASTYAGVAAGYKTALKGHYRRDLNKDYMVLAVEHAADLGTSYVTGEGSSYEYSNAFNCLPDKTPYRPPRVTPAPFISGSQTAFVVGPPGDDDIYPDKYGRVKVQFHWDRRGESNEKSSCWIRVAQSWAGKLWGGLFLPRVGQEVIVNFLEGDPDRPIITGCVYNADSMPPYKLPAEKTKSTIKSHSSPKGSGFNELRFEDKKGAEQVFIHAERNQDVRVKRDVKEWVGQDAHLIVKRDQLEKVEGDKHLSVAGDRNEKVDGTVSLKAGQDLQEKVGAKYALDAGREVHIKGGMNVVIEAGVSITLKAGSGFIVVGPAGVTISGTPVLINSGGSPGAGSGCAPQAPKPPAEADKAESGQSAGPPPRASSYSPAAMVMKQAARNGTPFCEMCARK